VKRFVDTTIRIGMECLLRESHGIIQSMNSMQVFAKKSLFEILAFTYKIVATKFALLAFRNVRSAGIVAICLSELDLVSSADVLVRLNQP